MYSPTKNLKLGQKLLMLMVVGKLNMANAQRIKNSDPERRKDLKQATREKLDNQRLKIKAANQKKDLKDEKQLNLQDGQRQIKHRPCLR